VGGSFPLARASSKFDEFAYIKCIVLAIRQTSAFYLLIHRIFRRSRATPSARTARDAPSRFWRNKALCLPQAPPFARKFPRKKLNLCSTLCDVSAIRRNFDINIEIERRRRPVACMPCMKCKPTSHKIRSLRLFLSVLALHLCFTKGFALIFHIAISLK
jgi:hypothetical protein